MTAVVTTSGGRTNAHAAAAAVNFVFFFCAWMMMMMLFGGVVDVVDAFSLPPPLRRTTAYCYYDSNNKCKFNMSSRTGRRRRRRMIRRLGPTAGDFDVATSGRTTKGRGRSPLLLLFMSSPSSSPSSESSDQQQQEQQQQQQQDQSPTKMITTWDDWYEHQHQRQQRDSVGTAGDGHTNGDDDDDDDDEDSESPRATTSATRSIGDVVQGLHGSKYQFDNGSGSSSFSTSGGPFTSFEGRQFAEQGYSSSSSSIGYEQDDEDDDDEADLPNWAIKLFFTNPPPQSEGQYPTIDILSPSSSDPSTNTMITKKISIKNEERSWEKFYARIVVVSSGDRNNSVAADTSTRINVGVENAIQVQVQVRPSKGTLAPRNTNNNQFSDTTEIQVVVTTDAVSEEKTLLQQSQFEGDDDLTKRICLLRVGTEAESWTYNIRWID